MTAFNEAFRPLAAHEKEELLLQTKPQWLPPQSLWRQALSNKSIVSASILLLIFFLAAAIGPSLCPYTPEEAFLANKNLPPSLSHIFGTDDLGRDLFVRVCHGLRISLFIGLLAACFDVCFGATWGIASAMARKSIGQIMMRIAEMVYSFPYLIFAILITTIFGPGVFSIIGCMFLIGWINTARISRQLALEIKRSDYVLAAISLGTPTSGIIRRHILPNIVGPLVALVMLTIPQAIFAEAFLSFLGIGIQPPMASLGSLVSDAWGSMRYYPWKLFIPASIISLCIFAFTLLGDGIRDLLDPQTRNYFKSGTR